MPESLQLLTFQHIMQEPLPPADWLVEPLFAQGSRAVVFGEFGCKKTWLLEDLALSVASGQPWLGHFTVPRARPVLYVDEEMPEMELRRRIRRLASGQGLDEQTLPLRFLSHGGIRFRQPEDMERLLEQAQREGFNPEVVIVETLRRVLEGSENDSEAVGNFWRSVSPILTAGKTLIVSHHMRKRSAQGINDARDRASGSTDILAGADMAFAIERIDGGLLQMECVKSRMVAEPGAFRVRFQEETDDGPVRMVFDGFRETASHTESALQRVGVLIESFLRNQPGCEAQTAEIDTWLDAQGITQSRGEKARSFLKKAGRVTNPHQGYWQLRNPEGATEPSTSANSSASISSAVAEVSPTSDHRSREDSTDRIAPWDRPAARQW